MFKLKDKPSGDPAVPERARTRSTTSTMANSEHMPIDRC